MLLLIGCKEENIYINDCYKNVFATNDITAIFDISEYNDDIMCYNDIFIHITNKTEKTIAQIELEMVCFDEDENPIIDSFGDTYMKVKITDFIGRFSSSTYRFRRFHNKNISRITVTDINIHYIKCKK